MNEATKTRRLWGDDVTALLKGTGIDIGCGPDPVLPGVERFDKEHGDANRIRELVHGTYDFVFSSHTLEHMLDPRASIRDWWALVKPGGHLVVLVPDEDLYEQGAWPSLFNADHKHTFTISKRTSWSPVSVSLAELARGLEGGEIVSLELQDDGYDRRFLKHGIGPLGRASLLSQRAVGRILGRGIASLYRRLLAHLGFPVDQTAFDDGRLAQIQLIVRKTP